MSEQRRRMSAFTEADAAFTDALLPGLVTQLEGIGLMELEGEGSPVLDLFRKAKGPGLLIPARHGGHGLNCRDALRVQSALATLSPSLGVGTMMHHLAVVSFVEYLRVHVGDDAPQWALLASVAQRDHLLASASSEARRGSDALVPRTTATRQEDGGYVLNGSKKPCSLARSMDILTSSVLVRSDDEQDGTVALAVIPAAIEGVGVRPFWHSPVLVAAESEEVVLDQVHIPAAMVIPGGRPERGMDELQVRAWTWFEVLACGTYLGTAQSLFDRAASAPRVDRRTLGELAAELFVCRSACERAAATFDSGVAAGTAMTEALLARLYVEERLPDLCARIAKLLGGLAFVTGPEAAYLVSASRALAFHPPRGVSSAEALGERFTGAPLDLSIF